MIFGTIINLLDINNLISKKDLSAINSHSFIYTKAIGYGYHTRMYICTKCSYRFPIDVVLLIQRIKGREKCKLIRRMSSCDEYKMDEALR